MKIDVRSADYGEKRIRIEFSAHGRSNPGIEN